MKYFIILIVFILGCNEEKSPKIHPIAKIFKITEEYKHPSKLGKIKVYYAKDLINNKEVLIVNPPDKKILKIGDCIEYEHGCYYPVCEIYGGKLKETSRGFLIDCPK